MHSLSRKIFSTFCSLVIIYNLIIAPHCSIFQIFICYYRPYHRCPKSKRIKNLLELNKFECTCEACEEDWPTEDSLPVKSSKIVSNEYVCQIIREIFLVKLYHFMRNIWSNSFYRTFLSSIQLGVDREHHWGGRNSKTCQIVELLFDHTQFLAGGSTTVSSSKILWA